MLIIAWYLFNANGREGNSQSTTGSRYDELTYANRRLFYIGRGTDSNPSQDDYSNEINQWFGYYETDSNDGRLIWVQGDHPGPERRLAENSIVRNADPYSSADATTIVSEVLPQQNSASGNFECDRWFGVDDGYIGVDRNRKQNTY